ncbi:hypothetical protein L208DRAFT_1475318 [Tricholoma matsutake]|nr:hypothetical protein L208DRAFT_1475318 [Tricholoma matsutake 945]
MSSQVEPKPYLKNVGLILELLVQLFVLVCNLIPHIHLLSSSLSRLLDPSQISRSLTMMPSGLNMVNLLLQWPLFSLPHSVALHKIQKRRSILDTRLLNGSTTSGYLVLLSFVLFSLMKSGFISVNLFLGFMLSTGGRFLCLSSNMLINSSYDGLLNLRRSIATETSTAFTSYYPVSIPLSILQLKLHIWVLLVFMLSGPSKI